MSEPIWGEPIKLIAAELAALNEFFKSLRVKNRKGIMLIDPNPTVLFRKPK